MILGFAGSISSEAPPDKAGDIRDVGLIPELGRFPGIGNGNPFQYPCLKIPWTEEPGGLQSNRIARIRTWQRQLSRQCLHVNALN